MGWESAMALGGAGLLYQGLKGADPSKIRAMMLNNPMIKEQLRRAGSLEGHGDEMMDYGREMMDIDSARNRRMKESMTTQSMDMAAQTERLGQQRAALTGTGTSSMLSQSMQQTNRQAMGDASKNWGNWVTGQSKEAGGMFSQAQGFFGQQNSLLGNVSNIYGDANSAQATQYSQNQAFKQQMVAGMIQKPMEALGTAATTKAMAMCLPPEAEIDTPNGSVDVADLKTGDEVIGFGGEVTTILQKHEYKEDPKVRRFLEITLDDGKELYLCDMHRIEGKRAQTFSIGDSIGGKVIEAIEWFDGVEISYDFLTSDAGYKMSGVSVNSMIEELAEMIHRKPNKEIRDIIANKSEALYA